MHFNNGGLLVPVCPGLDTSSAFSGKLSLTFLDNLHHPSLQQGAETNKPERGAFWDSCWNAVSKRDFP
jgi:hypothetical protein